MIVLCLALFLGYSTLTDYKPEKKETLAIAHSTLPQSIPPGKLELLTWNIGYCGLGAKMDFFYEGGTMVQPDKEYYAICRDGVINRLKSASKPDFILMQEVDQHSERTYLDNQVDRFKSAFSDYATFFALNYKVPFVPVPLTSPMGKVNSGILTMSRFQPIEATRYQYPSSYSWPKRLFLLDRCFELTRYKVSNGRQLVVINTHNSAFDDAAEMRAKELKLLKDMIVNEYSKGNYVIAGGDWNQNPLPFAMDSIRDGNIVKTISPGIPAGFLPAAYTWAYDPTHPTNRDVDKPYFKGKTKTTTIDFFVLSPNISLLSTHTLQYGFEFSDHQPVQMIVVLN